MRFLTRLTGKSLWLAVLGAANMVTLKSNKKVGALRFLFGTMTSLFVFVVAATGFAIVFFSILSLLLGCEEEFQVREG